MDDLISRQAAIEAVNTALFPKINTAKDAEKALRALPSAEPRYAQSIGKCETCCYWGNRMILRDGSLGDCGNFEKNLSKDFYCAWWSQKETVERGEEG